MTHAKGRRTTGRRVEYATTARKPLAVGFTDRRAPLALAALGAALWNCGIAKASENTDAWWRACAVRASEYLVAVGERFSPHHVQVLIATAAHRCRIGVRFRTAVHAKAICCPVGCTLWTGLSKHRGVQRLYQSGASQ